MTATEIRRDVEGYSDMTEDAFARRFYADRAELDALGIHLSVDKPADGFSEQENYSLAPEAFHLPPIAFTDSERAALQTALTLLDGEFAYAEPLRLALQQITWGRPRPLGSDSRQTIGLGITASAGGGEVSARLAKIDTAIYRRKRIEFEYHTMQSRRDRAARRSTRTTCCSRAGSSTSSATRTSATAVRVFRLSRIRGKVAYATKAEHDFQRPADFDPRGYANRIPWQLGDPIGDGRGRDPRGHRAGTSSASTAPTGRSSRPRRLPARRLRDPAAADLVGAGASGCGSSGRRRWSTRRARRVDALIEAHRGEPPSRRARARRPRRRRRSRPTAAARGSEAAIRPERFARLVTLATVLIAAGRAGERLQVAEVCAQLKHLAAGAARGRLGPERRQLRRRRVRDLRRGAADRRDRGRSGAVLGHVRPPRAAAADRGQGAGRGDRPDRAGAARICARRARRSSTRSGFDPVEEGLQIVSPDGRGRHHAHRRARGPRDAAARDRVLDPVRGPLLRRAWSSPTR